MPKRTKINQSPLADLIRQILPEDESLALEVQEQYDNQRLVSQLATLRNHREISQADVAQELGCKQSRISKLENGLDDDLSIKDLAAYAKLAHCDLTIVFASKNASPADKVKNHAMCISECLNNMNELVQADRLIRDGVAKFHIEALLNLVNIVGKASKGLRHSTKREDADPKISLRLPDATLECDDEHSPEVLTGNEKDRFGEKSSELVTS